MSDLEKVNCDFDKDITDTVLEKHFEHENIVGKKGVHPFIMPTDFDKKDDFQLVTEIYGKRYRVMDFYELFYYNEENDTNYNLYDGNTSMNYPLNYSIKNDSNAYNFIINNINNGYTYLTYTNADSNNIFFNIVNNAYFNIFGVSLDTTNNLYINIWKNYISEKIYDYFDINYKGDFYYNKLSYNEIIYNFIISDLSIYFPKVLEKNNKFNRRIHFINLNDFKIINKIFIERNNKRYMIDLSRIKSEYTDINILYLSINRNENIKFFYENMLYEELYINFNLSFFSSSNTVYFYANEYERKLKLPYKNLYNSYFGQIKNNDLYHSSNKLLTLYGI